MDAKDTSALAQERLAAVSQLSETLAQQVDEQRIIAAVLDTLERGLPSCDSAFFLVDETQRVMRMAARRGPRMPESGPALSLDGPGIVVAVVRRGQTIYLPDVRRDARYLDVGLDSRSELAVPIKIAGQVLGVLNVENPALDAFTASDEHLVSVLASWAALALENCRLHDRERRRAAELASVQPITRRISANLDLQETLDTIVGAAAELVPCTLAEISLWDREQQVLVLQAHRGADERAWPIGRAFPPGKGYTGWVVRNRLPLLVPDVAAHQDIRPDLLPGEQPFQGYIGLPLLAGEELIGTLVLVHDQAAAFGEQHLVLLQDLAGQAVVAIGNARLYEELVHRHRELAALYAVAETANQPFDLRNLMQQALERVVEVTHAHGGAIRLLDSGTQELVLTAHCGLSARYTREAARFPITEEIVGWVARAGEPVISADMWADDRVSPPVRALLQEAGQRSLAQVPLQAQDRVVGTLGIVSRDPGFFTPDDLRLLNAIGQQLGMAIANAQLFEETRHRARRLAALNAVAAVINQSLSLPEMLERAIDEVIAVVETEAGGIRLREAATGDLVMVAQRGFSPEHLRQIERLGMGEGVVGAVAASGKVAVVTDLADDPRLTRSAAREAGFQTLAVVPLKAQEQVVGTLGVATQQHREFSAEEMELLAAIGHQIGVAVENARLRQQASEVERLVAVGRVAGTVAHDLRSPLGGIIRSAEFLSRPELSDATRQKLSQAIVALSRRLLSSVQEILDFTRGAPLDLQPASHDLPQFLDGILEVLRVDFSDRGIEVRTEWGYAGPAWIDADRVAQVVYNIAANARDAMGEGGQLVVQTLQVGKQVEIRFTDTGPGVPAEWAERIFEPFFSHGKREGAGLGLAIARRIVQEHGGELRLEHPAGGGATFVVRLPLRAPDQSQVAPATRGESSPGA